MIDLPPDLNEWEIYPQVPVAQRWMFNKLEIAERQGLVCGVSGSPLPTPGVYCIRPIYNLMGMGDGGVIRYVFDGTNQPRPLPGFFWCEWIDGYHEWVDYTDDQPVRWSGGLHQGRRWVLEDQRPEGAVHPTVPPPLRGLSKHLLIEWIGGKVIEVAPRHQKWLAGRENQIDYWARKWADPYYGYQSFFWKVVNKVDPDPPV